jgi:cell division protein FtsL
LRFKRRRYYGKAVPRRRKNQGICPRSVLWGLFLVLFIALGYIWQRVTVLKLSQDVRDLRGELSQVQKKYKYLNIEIASLSSVQRIESIAINDLGLSYPPAERIIYLDEPLISLPERLEDSFVLWEKLKKVTDGFISITEKRLEAKEIKYDL